MVAVFLADGFEISEAMVPLDYMRRAKINAHTVSVSGGEYVESSCGVTVKADMPICELNLSDIEAVVLPGGMPGAKNLAASNKVNEAVGAAAAAGKLVAAICASPAVVLAPRGLLANKKATCHPAFKEELPGSADAKTVYDPPFLTGMAAGEASEFGLEIVRILKGDAAVHEICRGLCL